MNKSLDYLGFGATAIEQFHFRNNEKSKIKASEVKLHISASGVSVEEKRAFKTQPNYVHIC